MVVNCYTISDKTCAIVPINKEKTKVYELDDIIEINENAFDIVNRSCLKYGSSYVGRAASTKYAIGYSHKAPICINQHNNVIFFPTKSPRLKDCAWISYNNIYIYSRLNKMCSITFKNKSTINVSSSFLTVQNQMFRSSRLENYMKNTFPHNCG